MLVLAGVTVINCKVAALKLIVMPLPVSVTEPDVGVNTTPGLLGVTVYVPFNKPWNEYAPEVLAVVVLLAAPLKVRVAPLPVAGGVMVPEMVRVPEAGRTSTILRL
jgi:hypothetical protein